MSDSKNLRKLLDIVNETTAGAVASVAMPIGKTESRTDPSVYETKVDVKNKPNSQMVERPDNKPEKSPPAFSLWGNSSRDFQNSIKKDKKGSWFEEDSEVEEAANPAQQAAIAVNMKKQGKKPKKVDESRFDRYRDDPFSYHGRMPRTDTLPQDSTSGQDYVQATDDRMKQNTINHILRLKPEWGRSDLELMRPAELIKILSDIQGMTEGLSWKLLDAGLSLDNKMAIFEEYYTKGNLVESIDEDKKSYFVSLFNMSSTPEKNKRYIVVPLSLIGNKILSLDKPSYLEYLGKSNGQLVFRSNSGEIRYPSKTIRDLSVFNTFTFSSADSYDKFRTALILKFDTNLPDVILKEKGVTEAKSLSDHDKQKMYRSVENNINRYAERLEDDYGPLEDWPTDLGERLWEDARYDVKYLLSKVDGSMRVLHAILKRIADDYEGMIQAGLAHNMLENGGFDDVYEGKTGPGLWANIRAKRERIKSGSGERMRKPGSSGAPTDQSIKSARQGSVKEATDDEKFDDILKSILGQEHEKDYNRIFGRSNRKDNQKNTHRDNPAVKLDIRNHSRSKVDEIANMPADQRSPEQIRAAMDRFYRLKQALKNFPRAAAQNDQSAKERERELKRYGQTLEEIESHLEENLHKWFKEKWVRFGPDGKIRGDCARGDDSEGKPKCLPRSKAHSLGKKGRASAAARKRREDPNAERSGKAINVATKKKSDKGSTE